MTPGTGINAPGANRTELDAGSWFGRPGVASEGGARERRSQGHEGEDDGARPRPCAVAWAARGADERCRVGNELLGAVRLQAGRLRGRANVGVQRGVREYATLCGERRISFGYQS